MNGLYMDPLSVTRSAGTGGSKVKQAAQQFEAILVKEIVKHAVPKTMSESMAGDTYSDMMADQLAGAIASSGQLGIGKLLEAAVGSRGAHFVEPKITSAFGTRTHPVTQQRHNHTGVDVAADVGTSIRAPFGGRVTSVARNDVGGLSVTLTHADNRTTTYRHLDQALLKEGNLVRERQVFAHTGNTGRTTGPHLHFELKENGNAVDPSAYVNRLFVQRKTQEVNQ